MFVSYFESDQVFLQYFRLILHSYGKMYRTYRLAIGCGTSGDPIRIIGILHPTANR